MFDDNIPSQKYRDTGIPPYFVTLSVIDYVSKIARIASSTETLAK